MKGPTAIINSIGKLEHTGDESTLLNLKFHPGSLQTKAGINKFIALLKTHFDNYAHHLQCNMLSKETLLNAKAHPEEYRDLVVRVAGFSAFWIELSPKVQDEIIARTELTLA
jgi:pyruvate-formate lyase